MRNLIAILVAVLGIILGAYVGIWLLFVGGIAGIVNGIAIGNVAMIAFGILKVMFCEIGALIVYIGFFAATAIKLI